jgi:hypothetical protein
MGVQQNAIARELSFHKKITMYLVIFLLDVAKSFTLVFFK